MDEILYGKVMIAEFNFQTLDFLFFIVVHFNFDSSFQNEVLIFSFISIYSLHLISSSFYHSQTIVPKMWIYQGDQWLRKIKKSADSQALKILHARQVKQQ